MTASANAAERSKRVTDATDPRPRLHETLCPASLAAPPRTSGALGLRRSSVDARDVRFTVPPSPADWRTHPRPNAPVQKPGRSGSAQSQPSDGATSNAFPRSMSRPRSSEMEMIARTLLSETPLITLRTTRSTTLRLRTKLCARVPRVVTLTMKRRLFLESDVDIVSVLFVIGVGANRVIV